MALCGVSSTPNLRSLELLQYARSSSIALKRNRSLCHPTSSSYRAKPVRLRCSSSNVEMEEDVRNSSSSSVSVEDESSAHVMQFKWNDFKILDRVSIGHGGRVYTQPLPVWLSLFFIFLLLIVFLLPYTYRPMSLCLKL